MRPLFPAVLLAVGALLAPTVARGNMAAPWHPGMAVGEPAAGLEKLTVLRERLTIDLRPLAGGEAAVVAAVYRVRNDGPARQVPLVFVADGLAPRGSGVWLDGGRIDASAGGAEGIPSQWQPPAATPRPGGGHLEYHTRGQGTLRFVLPFSPGEHEVRVVYRAQAAAYSGDSPAVFWQLGYVLAPAKDWAGFGGLDVRVLLPRGWRAAAQPALERRGDVLVGAWSRLPADGLALTVQAPAGGGAGHWVVLALLAAAGLALCLFAGRRLGAALARRGRSVAWALAPSSALALMWAVACGIGAAALPSMIGGSLGAQRAWTYGYGLGFMAILAIPLLFLAAFAAVQASAHLGGRAARREGAGGGKQKD
jgi:hypothetical protein